MTMTLGELAVRFGCELRGDPAASVDSVASLSLAGPRAVTFLANPKYVSQLKDTRAGVVILDARSAASSPVATLVAANPHATYARVAALLHPDPPLRPGIHPMAAVAPGAQVDASAEVAAHACVGDGARIGARCFIGPGCVIERNAVIGDDTKLVARVFVGHDVIFGARCIVQPGAVVGADGFGFAPEKGTWIKVPQVGRVTVGDDVEIGSNTTIDRGALEDTVIEEGVKLDNLIMIAHNVSHRRALGHRRLHGNCRQRGARQALHHRWPWRCHRSRDAVRRRGGAGHLVRFPFHHQAGCVFFRAAGRRGRRVAPHRRAPQAPGLDGRAHACPGKTRGLLGVEPGLFRGLTK